MRSGDVGVVCLAYVVCASFDCVLRQWPLFSLNIASASIPVAR